jgi:hypothetical protein
MNATLDTNNLLIGLVFSSIGIGYCIYGRKQKHKLAFYAGLALCFMPYFVGSNFLLCALSLLAMAAPKFIKL